MDEWTGGWMDGGWTENEYVPQKRRFVEQKSILRTLS